MAASWARLVDFGLESLEGLDSEIGEGKRTASEPQENRQTREIFAAEAARIATLKRTLAWQRPSRDEADGASALPPSPLFENPEDAEEATEIPAPAVAGSSTRGLLLHKLIEEILTGELQGGVQDIERRTVEFLGQLDIKPVDDPQTGIAPKEIAGTVVRTLNLPEIAQLHSRLVRNIVCLATGRPPTAKSLFLALPMPLLLIAMAGSKQ
jgi:hypothetical protein